MVQAVDPARSLWPGRVPLIALSALTAGLAWGMLGSLHLHFSSSMRTTSEGLGAAAAGTLIGLLPGFVRFRTHPSSSVSSVYLGVCGAVSGVSLGVAAVLSPRGLGLVPLLAVGLGVGASWGLAVDLALPVLLCRNGPAVLGLCGAGLGLGGVMASLSAATAVTAVSAQLLLPLAVAVAFLSGWVGIRGREVWRGMSGHSAESTRPNPGAVPRRVLMATSLLLQASAFGIAAVWLLVYASRMYGLSLGQGLTVLAGLWLALAVGLTAGRHLPPIRDSVVSLVVPAALVTAGGGSLHFAGGLIGVALGTLLIGAGTGVLVLATLRLADPSGALGVSAGVVRSVRAYPVVGLVLGWPVGILSVHAGAPVLLIAIVGCLVVAMVALTVLIGDYRLSGDPAVI